MRGVHQLRGRGPVVGGRRLVVAAAAIAVVLAGGCSSGSSGAPGTSSTGGSARTGSTTGPADNAADTPVDPDAPQAVTPVLAEVPDPPIPFAGSDGRTHLVYEVAVGNATRGDAQLRRLEVRDADTGVVLATLEGAALVDAFQLVDGRAAGGVLGASQMGFVFVELALDGPDVPDRLTHQLTAALPDAAAGPQELVEEVAPVEVDRRAVPELGPPLRGTGYVAADACCTAHRHRRAVLPINGRLHLAQRYAVDWEQLHDDDRVFHGDRTDPRSYAIYGEETLAVADATVVRVVDGLPDQVPGRAPEGIDVDDADGNSVVLDLGGGTFVMYAHLRPGSVRVAVGERVRRGDVLGLVGNSGNSIAPHLHLHVMDRPLPVASSGLPSTIDRFVVTGRSASTEAFDRAEAEGTPLELVPVDPPSSHTDQYPMDQSIVTLGEPTPVGTGG